MLVTIGGAMSTAELGLSLAEMIRQDKVHGICCTGANLEEDVFNLVAHDFYERVPNYRDLTPADEAKLLSRHMNRVTDTCIPEMEAMRRMRTRCSKSGCAPTRPASDSSPTSFIYKILLSGALKASYQIDPKIVGCWPPRKKTCPCSCPAGRFHAGQHVRGHCISQDVRRYTPFGRG